MSKVAILGSPERSDAKEGAACVTPLCLAPMRLLEDRLSLWVPCKAAIVICSPIVLVC